jgi:hypothetical protein
MSEKKFSPLYLSKLTVEEIYSLCKSSIDLSQPLSDNLGTIATAAFNLLVTENAGLGTSLNRNIKSELSETIRQYDQARDEDIRQLFQLNKSYLNSRNAEKKAAASQLGLFLTPYKGAEKLPLDVQSAVIFELISKYNASAELQGAASAIGLTDIFTSLANNNTQFDSLYNQRTISKSARGASASTLRGKVSTAYTQFATAVEQTVNFTPSDSLLSLFNQLDELRKQYRQLETTTKKKEEEKQ